MKYLLIEMSGLGNQTITVYNSAVELVRFKPDLIAWDEWGDLHIMDELTDLFKVDYRHDTIVVDQFYDFDDDFKTLIPRTENQKEEEEEWIPIELNGLIVKVPAGTTRDEIAVALGGARPCC